MTCHRVVEPEQEAEKQTTVDPEEILTKDEIDFENAIAKDAFDKIDTVRYICAII